MDHSFQSGYDSEYPAIHDVTSRDLGSLVLLYGTSELGAYTALGLSIGRTQRRVEYIQNEPTVPANGSLSFGYFGEDGHSADVNDPGTDVLSIEQQMPRTLVEYGIAVEPAGLYVGVENPNGSRLSGLNPQSDRARGLDEDTLDQYSGVLSDYTAIDSPDGAQPIPTTALSNKREQGIIRFDSRKSGDNVTRFAFKNPTGSDITPDVTAVGRTYRVDPITDEAEVRSMLRDDKTRVVTYGGFDNSNPNLPPDWYDSKVTIEHGEL